MIFSFISRKQFFNILGLGKKILYVEKDKCTDISDSPAHQLVQKLKCSHLEADTAMLFVYAKIRDDDQTTPVLIDSEDADVVVLCAYATFRISGKLALKRKTRIIDCKQLCSEEMSKVVIPLHVVTGCDVTSSFFGVGKKTVWLRVEKNVEARQLLSNLNQDNLTKFVIRYIYNDKNSSSLSEMRLRKWKKMKSKKAKSIARLGPDTNSNFHRNERVMYHVNNLLNFMDPCQPPDPLESNGYFIQNNLCQPIMSSLPPLPENLMMATYIPADVDHSDSNDSDIESDEDIDIDGEEFYVDVDERIDI